MSKKLLLGGLVAALVTVLSGCVVVPARPYHQGYGYYEGGYGYARPAPPPRYYYPYYGRGGY
jgi:hypothetical protein